MNRAGRRLGLALVWSAALAAGCTPEARAAPEARVELERTGRAVFTQKCWGCHHEQVLAFGPSFAWIAKNRPEGLIRAQILDPAGTSVALGYRRSAMPRIPLTPAELEGVVTLIRRAGRGE